jgi:hypothetical protein
MTADGLALDSAPAATGGLSAPLSVSGILAICDGLLGEIGRRQHRFAWLRPPGPGSEDWLVVDAYYPGNRVVVVCRDEPAAHDHLYAELVPPHGLRLLALAPAELGDRAAAATTLTRLIMELGPVPRPTGQALDEERMARESAMARVAASFVNATAPPAINRRPPTRAQAAAIRRAAHEADTRQAVTGIVLGIVLALALCVEMYIGVARFALNGGHWLLAFGIAFDVCARALGTIAAGRAGRQVWAWGCVIGGSPVVAAFALFQADGPLITEPGPIAGLVSVLAVSVIAFALLASALRI